jgi:DNA-binding NarL/FixJ family response regulator
MVKVISTQSVASEGERVTGCGAVVKVYARVLPAADAWHTGPDAESQPNAHRERDGWEVTPSGADHSHVAREKVFQDSIRAGGIVIIDDCTLHRDNLAAVFTLNGMAAPRVAWDLPSLIVALDGIAPDIVLLNIATRDCVSLLRAATGMIPGARVIVLGASEDDESKIVACAEAGVVGYHMRTDSLHDLLRLIRKVAAGETSCPPRISAILLRRISSLASQWQPVSKELALTKRETQILKMLELGRSNQDIATQLAIAVHTVKNHVHSLLSKLGVGSRAEAAALSRTIRLRQR